MNFDAVFCTFCAFLILCMTNGISTEPSSLTTPSIIKSHGYPVEEHIVQTSDGYILTMHRIPPIPSTRDRVPTRPVAFLMHGLLCTSTVWVLGGPLNGLAFLLAEQGFDVWMGNTRGNVYSRNHTSKSPLSQSFWDFDWHEIAIYDAKAMIEYALNETGADNLHYFGHSQGTTVFFVLTSMIPSFGSRINSAHMLAPVVFMDHMTHPLASTVGNLIGQPSVFSALFGSSEFFPNTKGMEILGYTSCRDESLIPNICFNVLFLIAGWDTPHLNTTMVPAIMATNPAGSSTKQFVHFLQGYRSGQFRQFDYGPALNGIRYGRLNPPDYEIANIDVPTYLYYSDNDYYCSLVDVYRLIFSMNPNSLQEAYRLPLPKWNHYDFIWGLDVGKILYQKVIEDAKKHFHGYS